MIYLRNKLCLYTVDEILQHLKSCIEKKSPFSLLRYGDGGLKFLHSILFNDDEQLNIILDKEGIPKDKFIYVFEKWGYYARRANYIDTPQVYFSDYFWPRVRNKMKPMHKHTIEKLEMWQDLYYRGEFDNNHFCNPEFNYLCCIKKNGNDTIIDIIKNKRICCITTREDIVEHLPCTIDVIKIVKHYENQYEKSFHTVMSYIEKSSKIYDLWIVAAGELGRLYTGAIKENGGRAIDMGFVVDYWCTGEIPVRLEFFIQQHPLNPLEFILTDRGMKYANYI